MLPPEFACSGIYVIMISGGSFPDEVSVKKRKKEDIKEMTLKKQKAISKSLYSSEKSGDMYIELEKENYMDNAKIKFLTCNNLNLAVKNTNKKQYEAAVYAYKSFTNMINK